MKILLMIILFLCTTQIFANSLDDKLKLLGVSIDYAQELEVSLEFCSQDTNLMLSVIMVESSFARKSYNNQTNDYGLMQINQYHVDKIGLDKQLLMDSVLYNVLVGCEIMSWFTRRYKLNEAIMRYNVGTAKQAIKTKTAKRYLTKVLYWKKKLDKLNTKSIVNNTSLYPERFCKPKIP